MKRTMAAMGAFVCAWTLACAASRSDGSSAAEARKPGSKRLVEIEVFADFRVAPDPVRLSKSGNHEAHWILKEGDGPLAIETKESADEWPLDVTCESATRCVGKIKANGKRGEHAYRVVIGGKPGPDPVIIIEP